MSRLITILTGLFIFFSRAIFLALAAIISGFMIQWFDPEVMTEGIFFIAGVAFFFGGLMDVICSGSYERGA